MPQLREERDADLIPANEPTTYATDVNKFEVPCSVCGSMLYVDESIRDDVERAVEKNLENPFICPDCEEQYEEAAHA